MTRPTARVLALLEALQSGGTNTAADLAARLGVDERTLRRYVEHLIDLEVPVESVRGRHGGYRLAPGFRMPPLMLTDAEALAVLLGLLTGPMAASGSAASGSAASGSAASGSAALGAAGFGSAAASAAAKVRRVLPRALAGRLDALLQTIEFTAPPRPAVSPEAGVLLAVAEAARSRQPIAVRYTDRAGRDSDRTVHPYGIVAHAGRWYVTGADSASGEVRSFRLDRITTVTAVAGRFEPPPDFDPAARLLAGFAEAPYRHEVSVRVEAGADEVRRRLPPGLATVHDLDDGSARLELRAERLDWVPALLAGLDHPFTIERPAELRDRVRTLAGRLAEAASAATWHAQPE